MRIFLLFLFIVIQNVASAQKAMLFFYDKDWYLTLKSKAEYFRVAAVDSIGKHFHGDVTDHFKTGVVQMKGSYYQGVKIDSFYFFYENGKLESKGIFTNNVRDGIWKYYYRNGRLQQVVDFTALDFIIKENYDSLGNNLIPNGNGVWQDVFYYSDPHIPMRIRVIGEIKNFQKNGNWKIYTSFPEVKEILEQTVKFKNGECYGPIYKGSVVSTFFPSPDKLHITEDFRYSSFVSRQNYPLINKIPDKIDSLELPYNKDAEFPGGDVKFIGYVHKNTRHSLSQLMKKKESISIRFIVDVTGLVGNVMVSLTDAEVNTENLKKIYNYLIKIIEESPKWTPAERDGRLARQKYEIVFRREKGGVSTMLYR